MFVRHPFERLLSAYRDKVSKISQLNFDNMVWSDIVKGNELEIEMFSHIAGELDLTQYDAALQVFDIAAFHTFVHYLVNRKRVKVWTG